jgi:hypothetical protein
MDHHREAEHGRETGMSGYLEAQPAGTDREGCQYIRAATGLQMCLPAAQLSQDRYKVIDESVKGLMYQMGLFGLSGVSNLFKDATVRVVISAAPKKK